MGNENTELQNEVEKLEKNIQDKITEATKDVALKSDIEDVKKEVKDIVDIVKDMGKSQPTNNDTATYKAMIKQQIKEAVKENIEAIRKISGTSEKQRVEKALPITTAGFSNGAGYLTEYERGVTDIKQRTPFMRELIDVKPITLPYVSWAEQASISSAVDVTDEGAAKKAVEIAWIAKTMKASKITAFTKVSEETLDDIDFAAEDIATTLTELILIKEDDKIVNGTGTGDGADIKGIIAYAVAFAVTDVVNTSFYQKIPYASRLDVLRIAIALINAANFQADTILLNPIDAALLELTKTTNGSYIIPPFKLSNGVEYPGITVKENNGITLGTFIVGDMTKSHYRIRKELSLEFGREGDDFKKNLISAVAEVRGAHYIKENEKPAFIKGTFSDCITAIRAADASQPVSIISPLNQDGDAIVIDEKGA